MLFIKIIRIPDSDLQIVGLDYILKLRSVFSVPYSSKHCLGTSSSAQFSAMVRHGCHILVGTPGRINDFLERGKINLSEVSSLITSHGH